MKETQYRSFSLRTHKKNWRINSPNVCQFELTFKCSLHCRHCYADCYNKPDFIKDELDTKKIKLILDKVYSAGAIWLCLTGGDPLARKDFLEIYSYAKNKGFIVTLFTNAYSMTEEIADYLEKSPPFVIEITLNAVMKKTFEDISQVKGSFGKVMEGIKMITSRKLPLKIKTQVTKDNLEGLPGIKDFVEDLGLNFKPSPILHARLDKNLSPCSLRIKPEEAVELGKRLLDTGDKLADDDCRLMPITENRPPKTGHQLLNASHHAPSAKNQKPDTHLFSCAISGGDMVYIDPYGNLVPCICIRKPKINLCRESIKEARRNILTWVRSRTFTTS
jgi:MoaA/NifB/PqqE/SkfB family radical SAM enzyme